MTIFLIEFVHSLFIVIIIVILNFVYLSGGPVY